MNLTINNKKTYNNNEKRFNTLYINLSQMITENTKYIVN